MESRYIITHKKWDGGLLLHITALLFLSLVYFSLFASWISHIFGGVILYFFYCLPIIVCILFPGERGKLQEGIGPTQKMIACYTVFLLIYCLIFQWVRPSHGVPSNEFLGFSIQLPVFHMIGITLVVLFSFYMIRRKPDKGSIRILWLVIFFLIADMVLSLIYLSNNPQAIKQMTGNINTVDYGLFGVSNYYIVYSCVLLIPVYLFGFNRLHGWKRVVWRTAALLNFVFIAGSGFMLVIFLSILIVLLYLFMLMKSSYRFLLFVPLLLIVIVLFYSDVVYNLLISLSERVSNYELQQRFIAIADLLKYGDVSSPTMARLDLYKQSIRAFLHHPLFGALNNDTYALSGHSTLLDIMGGTGLMGLLPYLGFLYYSLQSALTYAQDRQYRKCIYASYIVFLVMSTVNPVFSYTPICATLFFLVPALSDLFLPAFNQQKKNSLVCSKYIKQRGTVR